jgi:hypothetical protein
MLRETQEKGRGGEREGGGRQSRAIYISQHFRVALNRDKKDPFKCPWRQLLKNHHWYLPKSNKISRPYLIRFNFKQYKKDVQSLKSSAEWREKVVQTFFILSASCQRGNNFRKKIVETDVRK